MKKRKSAYIGTFELGGKGPALGHLMLRHRDTLLRVYGNSRTHFAPDCILGQLNDQTKLSLHGCILLNSRELAREGGISSEADIFPHFVIEGKRHLGSEETSIRKSTLFIEDAASLFYDYDAFGSLLRPELLIQEVAAQKEHKRPIPIGPDPQIAYFAGRREILKVETQLGAFSATHCPSFAMGGPRGVSIRNSICVSLAYPEAVTFDVAFERSLRLVAFLELAIGRQQSIRRHLLEIEDGAKRTSLRLHWSYRPIRAHDRLDDQRSPHPADVLFAPIDKPIEFATVLSKWISSDGDYQSSRQRFHGSFIQGNRYTIDRLVGAANMFDILPDAAVPSESALTSELVEAKQKARSLFASLPEGDERNTMLNALGRLGKANLKSKVRFRGNIVLSKVGNRFPRLHEVLDESINCRNHFVHGASTRIDYTSNNDLLPFFVQTLEFVFAASDLVECGWDIASYINKGSTGSHPFGEYRINYAEHLKGLPKREG